MNLSAEISTITTVGDVLRHLFPNGTSTSKGKSVKEPPTIPDMFAASAYLIKTAGLSSLVDPSPPHFDRRETRRQDGFLSLEPTFYNDFDRVKRKIGKQLEKLRLATIEIENARALIRRLEREIVRAREAGASVENLETQLRELNDNVDNNEAEIAKITVKILKRQSEFLQPLWEGLLACKDDAVMSITANSDEIYFGGRRQAAKWWGACLKLLIATDGLCEGIGFPIDFSKENAIGSLQAYDLNYLTQDEYSETGRSLAPIWTLAPFVSEAVAVTLPKSVSPAVGATIRSLSQNLALLPPYGQTGATWVYTPHTLESDQKPFNLLVIPIPYYFHADAFGEDGIFESKGWGFFEIQPSWLENVSKPKFLAFVEALCIDAASKAGKVDGIVFPEAALTEELFEALVQEIEGCDANSVFKEIEFVVSGLVDANNERGNFVSTVCFATINGMLKKEVFRTTRAKHHRWKVQDEQIKTYRLSHVLNCSLNWWENLPPRGRFLNFSRFRNTSSFAALICEDLARIDPCQEVLRAVGPDLVIAILMDSVQIKERWPARYATVLADDPGCSVLTLTSYALIKRANDELLRQGKLKTEDKKQSIGLWKDSSTWEGVAIELPDGSDAVLLTISNKRRPVSTIDGRIPGRKAQWSWHLTDQRPITTSSQSEDFKSLFIRAGEDER